MKSLAVLVADDVADIQHIIRCWLSEVGHQVTCASSGTEAIRLLHRQSFDLIITDVIMPEGDGLDLIREARSHAREVRILAISGGGRFLKRETCLEMSEALGAHGLLLKPFNREQFMAELNQTMAV